ncbi:MAG: helix-turn-helix domain-containing protein [Thermofilaceae archaeon]
MKAGVVSSMLKSEGFKVIDSSSEGYAFNVIASTPGGTLAVKAAENFESSMIKRCAENLKKLGKSIDLTPLIICDEEVVDDSLVAYRGVPAVNFKTFKKILKGEELPFIYFDKGGIYVKLHGNLIRTKREEKGMSLGELAYQIGVSRRMVYEYEVGRADATLDVALKLIKVLGDEILERLSLESISVYFTLEVEQKSHEKNYLQDPTLRRLFDILGELGYIRYTLEMTPFQVAAKNIVGNKRLIIRKTLENGEGEYLTIEMAKVCNSYAILIDEDKIRIASDQILEAPKNVLEKKNKLENFLSENFTHEY